LGRRDLAARRRVLGHPAGHLAQERAPGAQHRLRLAHLRLDKGAPRVLLPTGNRAQFSSLPEDVIEKLDLIFYSDFDRAMARVVER
jgi:hypothetical protein